MADLTNCKCPACTGPLHFSSESGRLECEYCGSSFTVEEIEALLAQQPPAEPQPEPGWQQEETAGTWDPEQENLRFYSCPSCGAQLICDESTAATSCPYCGNPAIVPGRVEGTLKPDYVIPFRKGKRDAEAALRRHYRKKLLLPRVFAEENHIREVRGIYVPFWLFDGQAQGDVEFAATRTSSHREGDYQVTETAHYRVLRSGALSFEMVPVDGSEKMPDDLMDSLEPYDYRDLVKFSTAYLPGYFADKYDVSADDASVRAEQRCLNSAADAMRKTVRGYETVTVSSNDMTLKRGYVRYALLPVWLLTTKWKDKTYLFAMNGQTGKIVGDLPVDPGKKAALFWSTLAGAALLLSIFCSGALGRFVMGFFRMMLD